MLRLTNNEIVWIINTLKADMHHMDFEGMMLSKREVERIVDKLNEEVKTSTV